jgi:uncharacterized protein (TIGR00725 family)
VKRIVAVIGGGSCPQEDAARARRVGRLLAERGYVVLTGGLGGVMEAASRGAKEAGGLTVGVLPGFSDGDANPFVDVVLTSGLSEARNLIVATSGRAVVAVGGGLGTLSEIAFALKHGRAVIGLDTWLLAEHRVPGEGVLVVESPDEAVEAVDAVYGKGEGRA